MIRSHTGTPPTGTRSLAALLAKDGSGFDKNWSDYDILDNAVGPSGPSWPPSRRVRSRYSH